MKRYESLSVVCIILLILGIVLSGCSQEVTKEELPEVFELSMATIHPDVDPMNSIINKSWFNWLESESGGRIQMTLYPAGQAAGAADCYDSARTGVVDIACQCSAFTPGRFPLNEVVTLPLVIKHPASASTAQTLMALNDKYPELRAEFPNVKVLMFHASGSSQVLTREKPIHTLQDWKGQVVIASGKYTAATVDEWGGIPESIDFAEWYDSLSKGVVDGACTNWQAVQIFSYGDVINYATEVGFAEDNFLVHVMNQNTWDSLPADLQELFVGDNALNLATLFGYRFDDDDMAAKGILSDQLTGRGYPEVYVLPDEERARWTEAAEPVWEQWISDAEAKGAPGQVILNDAIAFAEQYRYENTPFDWCEQTLHDWGAEGY